MAPPWLTLASSRLDAAGHARDELVARTRGPGPARCGRSRAHGRRRRPQATTPACSLQRRRNLFGEMAAVRQPRRSVEIRQLPHGFLGPVQAREVLQRDDHRPPCAGRPCLDQFGFLVHADLAPPERLQAVIEAEPAVARGAGDEGLARLDLLVGLSSSATNSSYRPSASGIDAQDLADHRRHVQRAALDAQFPVTDARDALREQQLRAARAQFLLHGAVAQQEAHAFDQQARVHALLREVAGAGRIGVADRPAGRCVRSASGSAARRLPVMLRGSRGRPRSRTSSAS